MDSESIVQEAAFTAFSLIIITKCEKIEPFIIDVFKIITNVFNKYTGPCLLNLYDIFTLLTENFEDHFRNEKISGELIKCVVNKWYETINSFFNSIDNSIDEKKKNFNNICAVFDMIISLIKASGDILNIFLKDFLEGTLKVLNKNYEIFETGNKDYDLLDKDMIIKCFDLISTLYYSVPSFMINYNKKNQLIELIFKFIDINENFLNHHGIALLGDIGRFDTLIFHENIKYIFNILIMYIELPTILKNNDNSEFNNEPIQMEKFSMCNNSCWTLGILAISYPDTLFEYIHIIMSKLTKIISFPKVIKTIKI